MSLVGVLQEQLIVLQAGLKIRLAKARLLTLWPI